MRIKLLCLSLLLLPPLSSRAILPDTVYIRRPEMLGLTYRELPVTTEDGYRIATWFFPAQATLPAAEPDSQQEQATDSATVDGGRRPTIVICNGDAGNMSYFQLHLAAAWVSRGFNVVTFDWRGFGASSPFPMDRNYLCYTEMLENYRAVVNATAKLPEVRRYAITVMGWSTGAYLSMITAHDNIHVAAFIGRSLTTNFEDFIPLVMQVRDKTRQQLIIPADFPVERMPVRIAPGFTKPIFLICGENDLRTPVWMSRKILELLPDNVPHELMVVGNAAHGGREDPVLIDFENFVTRTTDFLTRNGVGLDPGDVHYDKQ